MKFNKIDILKLIGLSIKAASGVIGGSMILEQTKPYLTLTVLAIGAVANEIVSAIKEKEYKKNSNENAN